MEKVFHTQIGTDLAEAKRLLLQGEVVVIPTETVYGLAANGLDSNAVLKIYEAKSRPQFNPLILHVANLTQLQNYVTEIPSIALQLIAHFMPGPLTLLLNKQAHVPDLVTAGSTRVAIRIPQHPIALELLQDLDFPLAAPSANPSGYISPTTTAHVFAQLQSKIPYILEGGECKVGVESTIVGFEDGLPCVYRLGGVGIERLEEIIGEVKLLNFEESHSPQTSGQLLSHYAPTIPLIMGNLKLLLKEYGTEKVAILSFQDYYPELPTSHQRILSPNGDLNEAAQQLFAALRYLDTLEVRAILAEPVPNAGIGRAINDRLTRARFENKLL